MNQKLSHHQTKRIRIIDDKATISFLLKLSLIAAILLFLIQCKVSKNRHDKSICQDTSELVDFGDLQEFNKSAINIEKVVALESNKLCMIGNIKQVMVH